MSALADQVAAEHSPEEPWRCGCGQPWREDEVWEDAYTRHVAEVTERAVRAQIVADIEAKRLASPSLCDGAYGYAARIAAGGAS